MNEKANKEGNISSLSVEQLLDLLNSPHKNVVEEVRSIIKGQFNTITDRWLVHGLMEYFFLTSSKRVLDLLIAAPEPHDKYLLDKVADGIKDKERFRPLSLLLYSISRNPPPAWVYKQHIYNTISTLISFLKTASKKEHDIGDLVSGVMVLVVLLPILPMQLQKYSSKIFECFWVLIFWTPSREHDMISMLHLQIALYSLFHRLYAIYPCSFLGFLRSQTTGQVKKVLHLNKLKPMLERVRLHPLLVSEIRETECTKTRWIGLEPSDVIHECAKLCLDPMQDICEETYSRNITDNQFISETITEGCGFVLYTSESSFWSPGMVQSPSSGTASIPQTPVYNKYHILTNQSAGTGIAESPPEAAIEATPETTPFTSPLPRISPSPMKLDSRFKIPGLVLTKPNIKINLTSSLDICKGKGMLPLDEVVTPKLPFMETNATLNPEKSNVIINKLKQIQHEREYFKSDECSHDRNEQQLFEKEETKPIVDDTKLEVCRRRKAAVFNQCIADIDKQQDLFSEVIGAKLEANQNETDIHVEDLNIESESFNSDDGQLRVPDHQVIKELVKNVNTGRLRFLSQCGPPPNIAFLINEPTKVEKSKTLTFRQRSRSFPSLLCDNCHNIKRDTTHSSLSLSPTRPIVEMIEVSTQTEEIPIFNPYEQLLEVLTLPNQTPVKEPVSPYQTLDEFIEFGCKGDSIPNSELGWNKMQNKSSDIDRSQLRSMHAIIVLERYKREMHAERNRRLLSQIKKLHSLQEKDKGLSKEKVCLKDEILLMQDNIKKLQGKLSEYKNLFDEMVEKKVFLELKEKEKNVCQQREQLRQMCGTLYGQNKSLVMELESCKANMYDMQRNLDVHCKQRVENESLRKQVIDLNKKIVVLGEIQNEMRSHMKDFKYNQRRAKDLQHAQLINELYRKIQHLEYANKIETANLDATSFCNKQLELKLKDKQIEIGNHKKEIDALSAMWQERCAMLEKRNKGLQSINNTLESQMLQLLASKQIKEAEEVAVSRRHVPATGQEGFLPLPDSQKFSFSLCNESESSFVAQSTVDTFQPI